MNPLLTFDAKDALVILLAMHIMTTGLFLAMGLGLSFTPVTSSGSDVLVTFPSGIAFYSQE